MEIKLVTFVCVCGGFFRIQPSREVVHVSTPDEDHQCARLGYIQSFAKFITY